MYNNVRISILIYYKDLRHGPTEHTRVFRPSLNGVREGRVPETYSAYVWVGARKVHWVTLPWSGKTPTH